MRRASVMVGVVVMAAVLSACGSKGSDSDSQSSAPLTPEQLIARGHTIFQSTCAVCHGDNLSGTSMAPSMLQPAFAPGQTPDIAFANAIQRGVPQKRFTKGPMPAQPSVAAKDIPAVIAYVRSVQQANGIR